MLALIAALLLSAAAHWLALTLAQAVAGTAAGVILPAAYGSTSLIAQPGQEARTLAASSPAGRCPWWPACRCRR